MTMRRSSLAEVHGALRTIEQYYSAGMRPTAKDRVRQDALYKQTNRRFLHHEGQVLPGS